MTLQRTKPGMRIFAQDNTHTYNQEGFSTVDINQSWVKLATPANTVSYSLTFGDFDTVNNYTLYAQFVQNANPGDPFGVYSAPMHSYGKSHIRIQGSRRALIGKPTRQQVTKSIMRSRRPSRPARMAKVPGH